MEYCQGRAADGGSSIWHKYIKDMSQFENAAKKRINCKRYKDELNEYLLHHYDIQEIADKRFWTVVADLDKGLYKAKKCKPVSTQILLDAWKWGQRKLDSINRKNKMAKKGPKNDIERIPYDLAIIVKHIPDYLKAKAKRDAEEAEREAEAKNSVKINYNNIAIQQESKSNGLGDISDLLDEMF